MSTKRKSRSPGSSVDAPSAPPRDNVFLEPPDTDDIDDIFRYALAGKNDFFNGYDHAGAYLGVTAGDLANRVINGELDPHKLSFEELRVCLFFEQRRWRHYGYGPDGDDACKIVDLYKALRKAWAKRDA